MRRNETSKTTLGVVICAVGILLVAGQTVGAERESKRILLISLRDANNLEVIYSYVAVKDESYFDIINRQAKENRPPQSIWKKKRHIGFFGMLKEFAKEVGIKVVIPF